MRKDAPYVKASLGLIVAIALLGLAEVGSRLAGIAPAYRPDATGSWQVRAHLTDHRMQGTREPHNFSITTNAYGLRTPHSLDVPNRIFRVAVMGDSTVFGWGVSDQNSIAAVAESTLRAQGVDTIEVMNAGQPGYSTGMVEWLFENTVSLYKPHLTIVFVSMHDFNRTLISDIERHRGPQSLSAHIRTFLVKKVSLYELFRRQLYPLAHEAQLLPDAQTHERRVMRVSDQERSRALDTMASQAAAWGGDIAIGFLPFHRDMMVGPAAAVDRPGLKQAQTWSDSRKQTVFDLRNCCGPGADDRTFPFDRGHLNALGNTEVGTALASQIQAHLVSQ